MIPVFILIAIEKIINLALATDPITQAGLQPLAGKVMRLVIHEPKIEFDTLFNDDHVRFEPVTHLTSGLFEARGNTTNVVLAPPDCTVTVANPSQLLRLLGEPEGNLPIDGDYRVLMQVKTLVAGFDPDIVGKLQPIIGVSLASQLTGVLEGLKTMVGNPFAKSAQHAAQAFEDLQEKAAMPNSPRDELKQELLRLRAEIEREQARLAAIRAEQHQTLLPNHF